MRSFAERESLVDKLDYAREQGLTGVLGWALQTRPPHESQVVSMLKRGEFVTAIDVNGAARALGASSKVAADVALAYQQGEADLLAWGLEQDDPTLLEILIDRVTDTATPS